jgi:hypothetical protein
MSSHISHLSVDQATPVFMGGLPLLQPQRNTQLCEADSPAIKYEGFHGTYHTDPTQAGQSSPQRLDKIPVPESPSQGPSLMVLPPEVRLQIFSDNIIDIAGPAGTISVSPRAKALSNPSGDFQGHDCSGKDQTEWQARRGAQQLCSQLRAEALEALYKESTFFARMSQCEEGESSFERDRYDRWLKSLGGDENVRSIRRVTFGVEWPSYREGGEWHRRRGDVRVCIVRDGLVVDGSRRIAECPAAPLEKLKTFIAELMVGKVIRRGLGYDKWMAVWDKVQELMKSGWGSPY